MKIVAALSLVLFGLCHANPAQFDEPLPPFDDPLFDGPLFYPSQEEVAPWNSGKYQGDIVLTAEQERQLILNGTERNAMRAVQNTWIPVNKVIPFEFRPGVFSAEQQQQITEWVKDFERNTCLTVKPRTTETDYVEIFDDGGCYSYLGRTGGRQMLSLGRPNGRNGHCIWKATVLHEFMHASGFWHEQSRQDRDTYIKVATENVIPSMLGQFDKAPASQSRDIDNYDYQSIMQYRSTAFTRNGEKTMIRLDNSDDELGQPTGGTFTAADISKLNKLYQCGNTGTTTTTTTTTTTPAPTTTTTATTTTTRATTTTPNGNCFDVGARWWCRRNTRHCNSNYQSYRNYMRKYCRRTCNAC